MRSGLRLRLRAWERPEGEEGEVMLGRNWVWSPPPACPGSVGQGPSCRGPGGHGYSRSKREAGNQEGEESMHSGTGHQGYGLNQACLPMADTLDRMMMEDNDAH